MQPKSMMKHPAQLQRYPNRSRTLLECYAHVTRTKRAQAEDGHQRENTKGPPERMALISFMDPAERDKDTRATGDKGQPSPTFMSGTFRQLSL